MKKDKLWGNIKSKDTYNDITGFYNILRYMNKLK